MWATQVYRSTRTGRPWSDGGAGVAIRWLSLRAMVDRPFRVAIAQAHPSWGRSAETARLATEWIGRAAAERAGLLAFGETFLGGYPFWLSLTDGSRFEDPDQKRAHAYYLDAAVELDGPEVAAVVEAARDHRVFTYLGIAERGPGPARGTVFCTLVAVDP